MSERNRISFATDVEAQGIEEILREEGDEEIREEGEEGGRGEMTTDVAKFSTEDVWHMIDQCWLSDEMKSQICKTVARLPLDAQEFAVFNCTFIDFGGKEKGSAWPASVFTHPDRRGRTMRNHWLIILSCDLVKNEDDAQYTIAHEIAHARLAHQVIDSNFLREVEADELVESWGFVVPKYRLKIHAECRRLQAKYPPNEDENGLRARARAAKKAKKGAAK